MWHLAGTRLKPCQAMCKLLEHNWNPSKEWNRRVVLMVHIQAQSIGGRFATGSMYFSIRGYNVSSEPSEPTGALRCF